MKNYILGVIVGVIAGGALAMINEWYNYKSEEKWYGYGYADGWDSARYCAIESIIVNPNMEPLEAVKKLHKNDESKFSM